MRLNVVLPCRGEFGLVLRYHVPVVHALPGPKIVYHEVGCEALYPSASTRIAVPIPRDDDRRGMRPRGDAPFRRELTRVALERWPGARMVETRAGMPEARFVPEPFKYQGAKADVVLCPRARTYGASKNWSGWNAVRDALGRHRVFAAGAPDSSAELGCPAAWHYPRHLDASIEAMRGAKLVISTDAGLAHLAVLCGAPLLLVTHYGLVAPGPVLDPLGREMEPAYWPVRIQEYYHAANHRASPIWTSHAWEDPGKVAREALTILDGEGGKS